jgi:hypothetical protein
MLFKKNDSANLVSKSTKYWKNRSQKTKEAQNVVFNLKGRILLLFYCVKHIHGQFKTYLKLRNIHFEQTNSKKHPDCWEKPCRDILYNPFYFVCYRFLNLYDTISFDMSCFHCAVWCSDRLYCIFETCKVKSVIKILFRTV